MEKVDQDIKEFDPHEEVALTIEYDVPTKDGKKNFQYINWKSIVAVDEK